MESEQVPVQIPDGSRVTINRVLIQKGLDKQVILYWYQDRGRIIASEYWAKAYLVWDAITRNRTDGALVRISVPVERSSEQAFSQGVEFLREVFPRLPSNLPS
jgi:EpsI family protein